MTSSRPERCDWYSTKTGAWGKWLAISISTESALRNWVERARADRTQGRRGLTTEEREELRRLRKENRRLRVERDALKKAAAFFAREERVRFAFIQAEKASMSSHAPLSDTRRLPKRILRVAASSRLDPRAA